jgi:hypothetical protein
MPTLAPARKARPVSPHAVAPVRPRHALLPAQPAPRALPLRGLSRPVEVKIASEADEWEQAYRMVADSYRARGYEAGAPGLLRFTPFHALPDTATFVAKSGDEVVATLSLVADNVLLGLPMECIYREEVEELRRVGLQLVEVTCLADRDLSLREFVPVFTALMRLLSQYAVRSGSDAAVLTINPRHRAFYRKVMGGEPLGTPRAYPSVQNHPAEAYLLDPELMRVNAPGMYEQIFHMPLPDDAFLRRPMPLHLKRRFAALSTWPDADTFAEVFAFVEACGSPRRWR